LVNEAFRSENFSIIHVRFKEVANLDMHLLADMPGITI
jgi:hypothetical protein